MRQYPLRRYLSTNTCAIAARLIVVHHTHSYKGKLIALSMTPGYEMTSPSVRLEVTTEFGTNCHTALRGSKTGYAH